MVDQAKILLLVEDISVLSALRFSLSVEGFEIAEGIAKEGDLSTTAALVIDECYAGDGLVALDGLKRHGCCAPAIILATNPTVKLRARVALGSCSGFPGVALSVSLGSGL